MQSTSTYVCLQVVCNKCKFFELKMFSGSVGQKFHYIQLHQILESTTKSFHAAVIGLRGHDPNSTLHTDLSSEIQKNMFATSALDKSLELTIMVKLISSQNKISYRSFRCK